MLGVFQMAGGNSSTYLKTTAIHKILAKLLTVKVDVLLEKIMENVALAERHKCKFKIAGFAFELKYCVWCR